MRPTMSLLRREFSAYFLSPIAYVVLAVFLVVTGTLFYLTMLQLTARGPRGIYFPMQLMLSDSWFWLIFLVIPPLFLWVSRALYVLAGDGELVLRFTPFAAGVAALVLMVPLARRAVGGPHALWAVALLAVSRHAVEHGCDVRPYTTDLFFAELILLCALVLLGPASGRGRTRAS